MPYSFGVYCSCVFIAAWTFFLFRMFQEALRQVILLTAQWNYRTHLLFLDTIRVCWSLIGSNAWPTPQRTDVRDARVLEESGSSSGSARGCREQTYLHGRSLAGNSESLPQPQHFPHVSDSVVLCCISRGPEYSHSSPAVMQDVTVSGWVSGPSLYCQTSTWGTRVIKSWKP